MHAPTLGNVTLLPHLRVPILEDSTTYRSDNELGRALLELGLGGPGNLGMNDCATNLVFPWGGPNDNNLLFTDLARKMVSPHSVKPPLGRRHSSFNAYANATFESTE